MRRSPSPRIARGPSPAATAPSSPSSASNARPCSDDSFVSTATSLRPSASRSMPCTAARGGLRGDRGDTRELRRIEVEHGARIGAIGLLRRSCRDRARVSARAGPGLAPIALSRAASAGANGAINAGELAQRRGAGVQRQLAGGVDAVEIVRCLRSSRCRAGRSSTAPARSSSGRSRASPPAAAAPGRPIWRGRHRARAGLVRPLGLRPRQRTHQRGGGIEIEPFRLQFGLEPRAAARDGARTRCVPRPRRHRSRPSWRRSRSGSAPC